MYLRVSPPSSHPCRWSSLCGSEWESPLPVSPVERCVSESHSSPPRQWSGAARRTQRLDVRLFSPGTKQRHPCHRIPRRGSCQYRAEPAVARAAAVAVLRSLLLLLFFKARFSRSVCLRCGVVPDARSPALKCGSAS